MGVKRAWRTAPGQKARSCKNSDKVRIDCNVLADTYSQLYALSRRFGMPVGSVIDMLVREGVR